ncbi:hypothetical protein DAETH_11740 [Deinococcus aetherius]|uniref:Uncharacterized protein n=1 Tax=Deinococcus aetherius TaxID=200252 RepID=A0ABM8ABR8_9DEIO|nr:hypothetical protein [Deinococcus aetherius]BDP41205.1 hypothetical protein DAETH_11740 [Deinococcus aetherius]
MLARARSVALIGVDAVPVEVEVDVSPGLPAFTVVGLPDQAVSEARDDIFHLTCQWSPLCVSLPFALAVAA